MTQEVTGQQIQGVSASQYNALLFIVQQALNRLAGPTLVKVTAVTTSGDIAADGFVDVQPLVNQMSGEAQPTPHDIVHNLPYFRLRGGTNAVIMDPQVGDIGLCCFASRDISAVKSTMAQANPGSQRTWDWADGLYLGGFLNGVPKQYVQFNAQGIDVVSPTQITLQAPTVNIIASSQMNVQSPDSEFSGNLHTPQTITGDTDVIAAGKSGAHHTHSDPQGGNTGPPQ